MMEEIITATRSFVTHVGPNAIIPLIWWLFSGRKENYLTWVGLKKPLAKSGVIVSWILVCFALCAVSQVFLMPAILPKGFSAAQQYSGMGFAALIPAILAHGIGNFLLMMAEAYNLL